MDNDGFAHPSHEHGGNPGRTWTLREQPDGDWVVIFSDGHCENECAILSKWSHVSGVLLSVFELVSAGVRD